ncbi:hypothetical protein [Conservatibacter flavescens]|uniref:Uncharacterized protein n=1 Tax=Conservatibacter flavescens TaxID=28161 RepID=A0A2M8S4N6_9PAST|nr:hypothetical protein [Conservatibacter flavescens]PJG86094.1 hypothetical protein CVP05_02685 [Conservatibacter flavescens]
MFNILRRPFEKSTFEAWAKIFDDIAKVAFLGIPVIIYGEYPVEFKLFNIVILIVGIYIFILGGRVCRRTLELNAHKREE